MATPELDPRGPDRAINRNSLVQEIDNPHQDVSDLN